MTLLSTLGTWLILETSFAIGGLSAFVYPIPYGVHATEHTNPGAIVWIMVDLPHAPGVGASISPFFGGSREMGGTRRVVPILFRDLRVACGIYLLSADAPRPGTRDYRLRGKAANPAVKRLSCLPRSKNRRYRIARGGFIFVMKDRGGPPGEDRLPNPFHLKKIAGIHELGVGVFAGFLRGHDMFLRRLRGPRRSLTGHFLSQ